MTGPEHYQEAERLLAGAAGYFDQIEPNRIALAQVHATLALAAATARSTQSAMFTTLEEWRVVDEKKEAS